MFMFFKYNIYFFNVQYKDFMEMWKNRRIVVETTAHKVTISIC